MVFSSKKLSLEEMLSTLEGKEKNVSKDEWSTKKLTLQLSVGKHSLSDVIHLF